MQRRAAEPVQLRTNRHQRRPYGARHRAIVHTPPPPSTYELVPTTTIALAREPACFAFLCAEAEHPPVPIDALQIDIASADHFAGCSSVWATLEIRSAATGTSALLGFD